MVNSPPQAHRQAFTLLEVVLAIGLSTLVLLILTTAIHQFLFRIDASHGNVEASQLARALLNRMADDLRAARVAPASTGQASTGSQETLTSDQGGLGIVGTPTDVRIDRAAMWRWEPVPEVEPADVQGAPADETGAARTLHPPETVRYFLRAGDEVSSAELAQRGSQEIPHDSIAGLCFERWKTAQAQTGQPPAAQSETAQSPTESTQSSATTESVTSAYVELLAPEVIELEFAYADDAGELVDQWNSAEQGALPRAVDIQLTLRKELPQGPRDTRAARGRASRPDGTRRHAPGDIAIYRLLVKLPEVQPPRPLAAYSGGKSNASSASTSLDSSDSTKSSDSGGDTPRSLEPERQR
jgi:type II secretory pathway pseudopilin PulG